MSTSGGQGGQPLISLVTDAGGLSVPFTALRRWRTKARPAITELTVAALAGDGTLTVAQAGGFPGARTFRAYVDNETVLVTLNGATQVWTVIRGVNGTAAAAHALGAIVRGESTFRVAFLGDSTVEGVANTVVGEPWTTKLARWLAGYLGVPLLGPVMGSGGFYGIWRNNDANIGGGAGNSQTDWSSTAGAFTLNGAGNVNDRAPFGWVVNASGVGNVLKLAVPPHVGSVRAVDVYYVNIGTGIFSASVDGGASWVNVPGSGNVGLVNRVTRGRVTSGADITDFRVRAADQAGAAGATRFVGAMLWATAPTEGTTTGVVPFNFGKDSDLLSAFDRTNASGDNFGLLASDNNDCGAVDPDLVFVGPFTNDVDTWTDGVAYGNQLQDIINRLNPRCDVVLCCMAEQNLRSPVNQAALRQVVHNIATANGCGVLDMYSAFTAQGFVGWAAANGAGYFGGNANHFVDLGHTEMAMQASRLLTYA